MKYAYLHRGPSEDQGTFGEIYFGDKILYTGELPDFNNKSNISRINAGLYICEYTYSPSFKKNMYILTGVKGRSGIRIHSANFMGNKAQGYKCQLYGCIALGKKVGILSNQKALLISRPAISEFERWANKEPFELEIVDA